MSSIVQLLADKHDTTYAFNFSFFNKESIVSFSQLLVNHSLKTGKLEYPSLKYLKELASNCFSRRSIASYAKTLVLLGILQKLPRKKQQSYQLNLNHPLLRLLLAVYYPRKSLFIGESNPKPTNSALLEHYKMKLSSIFYSLDNLDDFVESTANELRYIIATNPVEQSVEVLKEKIHWKIMLQNSSDLLLEIKKEVDLLTNREGERYN